MAFVFLFVRRRGYDREDHQQMTTSSSDDVVVVACKVFFEALESKNCEVIRDTARRAQQAITLGLHGFTGAPHSDPPSAYWVTTNLLERMLAFLKWCKGFSHDDDTSSNGSGSPFIITLRQSENAVISTLISFVLASHAFKSDGGEHQEKIKSAFTAELHFLVYCANTQIRIFVDSGAIVMENAPPVSLVVDASTKAFLSTPMIQVPHECDYFWLASYVLLLLGGDGVADVLHSAAKPMPFPPPSTSRFNATLECVATAAAAAHEEAVVTLALMILRVATTYGSILIKEQSHHEQVNQKRSDQAMGETILAGDVVAIAKGSEALGRNVTRRTLAVSRETIHVVCRLQHIASRVMESTSSLPLAAGALHNHFLLWILQNSVFGTIVTAGLQSTDENRDLVLYLQEALFGGIHMLLKLSEASAVEGKGRTTVRFQMFSVPATSSGDSPVSGGSLVLKPSVSETPPPMSADTSGGATRPTRYSHPHAPKHLLSIGVLLSVIFASTSNNERREAEAKAIAWPDAVRGIFGLAVSYLVSTSRIHHTNGSAFLALSSLSDIEQLLQPLARCLDEEGPLAGSVSMFISDGLRHAAAAMVEVQEEGKRILADEGLLYRKLARQDQTDPRKELSFSSPQRPVDTNRSNISPTGGRDTTPNAKKEQLLTSMEGSKHFSDIANVVSMYLGALCEAWLPAPRPTSQSLSGKVAALWKLSVASIELGREDAIAAATLPPGFTASPLPDVNSLIRQSKTLNSDDWDCLSAFRERFCRVCDGGDDLANESSPPDVCGFLATIVDRLRRLQTNSALPLFLRVSLAFLNRALVEVLSLCPAQGTMDRSQVEEASVMCESYAQLLLVTPRVAAVVAVEYFTMAKELRCLIGKPLNESHVKKHSALHCYKDFVSISV